MAELLALLTPFVLIALGFTIGRLTESSHLRRLAAGEQEFADVRVTNLKRVADPGAVQRSDLVCGQVTIATDYFKTFAAALRNLIGGRVRTYETLLDRARREATLRMLAEARAIGATEVWNVRYATANIGVRRGKQGAAMAEIFAYGTAVVRKGAEPVVTARRIPTATTPAPDSMTAPPGIR